MHKAIENFKKATEDKPKTVLVTPMYLYQLGMAYSGCRQTGNDAKEAFQTRTR